jgi:hypothetical protein
MNHEDKVKRSLEWLIEADAAAKPWLYFAHPVSSAPNKNSAIAIRRAHALQEKYPVTFYVPGLWVAGSALESTVIPGLKKSEAYWFGLFASIIRHCHGVYREPDTLFHGAVSPGADAEERFADGLGVPVIRGEAELAWFLERRHLRGGAKAIR